MFTNYDSMHRQRRRTTRHRQRRSIDKKVARHKTDRLNFFNFLFCIIVLLNGLFMVHVKKIYTTFYLHKQTVSFFPRKSVSLDLVQYAWKSIKLNVLIFSVSPLSQYFLGWNFSH